ncbi:MAG TPA: GNAT family N-acetyltransferase [Gaiellaceae bacterium]|nr:GNAT family N-acetyltransferase [Gaiellaceae bacterium]
MNRRPFTEEDADAVAALLAADEERFYGRRSRLQGSDLLLYRHFWKEAWIYEEDGRIVASVTYSVHGDAANIRGIVGARGRGIGTQMLERGEAFAREHGVTKIHTGAPEPNADARALFESRGYREVRRFWEMGIDLAEEPAVPELPDGLVLDELRDGEQRAFYDALNEAFEDHWEWHPMPFDEWLEIRKDQHHDERGPVWFVIRDGDELAAVTRNDANVGGGGYVGAIGVRQAWRGKGLAKALLYRTFLEFWHRGTPRVTLDVDAQNETGATQLYERVGMEVEMCGVAFEKANA